jgi:hypothetical protein
VNHSGFPVGLISGFFLLRRIAALP